MENDEIRINRLTVRIPNLSEEESRQICAEALRRASERIPAHDRSRCLDSIILQVSIKPGSTREKLVTQISDAILRSLK